RKTHLDRRVLFRDPVAFRCEVGVLKYQNTSDGNGDAAERCLSEWAWRLPIEEYLGPRFGVYLHGYLKCNGRHCCLIGFDVVEDDGTQVAVAIFDSSMSRR